MILSVNRVFPTSAVNFVKDNSSQKSDSEASGTSNESRKPKSKKGLLGFKSTKIVCKKKPAPQEPVQQELPPLPPVPKLAPVVKPIADYHPSLDHTKGTANLGGVNKIYYQFILNP